MFNFAFTLLASLTGNLASSMTSIVEADPAPPELWHHLSKRPLGEVPQGMEVAYFGMGCFWGAERLFWERPGVWSTAVGYGGGDKVSPSYRQVCEGRTGHAELVRVVFDPAQIRYEDLLSLFWQNHDPTQGNRQGNDRGHQYRSAIYAATPEQFNAARASRDTYQGRLSASGFGVITTELRERAPTFYFAEEEHQQYLAKDPQGYCALAGTGISCPDWVS